MRAVRCRVFVAARRLRRTGGRCIECRRVQGRSRRGCFGEQTVERGGVEEPHAAGSMLYSDRTMRNDSVECGCVEHAGDVEPLRHPVHLSEARAAICASAWSPACSASSARAPTAPWPRPCGPPDRARVRAGTSRRSGPVELERLAEMRHRLVGVLRCDAGVHRCGGGIGRARAHLG